VTAQSASAAQPVAVPPARATNREINPALYRSPALQARWQKLEVNAPTFKATRAFFDAFGADTTAGMHEQMVLVTVGTGIANSIAAAAKRLGIRLTNVTADVFGTRDDRDLRVVNAEREKLQLALAEKQHEVDDAQRERDLYRAEVARLQESVTRLEDLVRKREKIDEERLAAYFGVNLDEVAV
jgi:hypothetical protein